MRHPVAQLDGGPAAEREHQDALGIRPLGHPRGHRLHQGGGLAGARTCENEHRTARMVNHGALLCVQVRGIRRDRRGTHQSIGTRVPLSYLRVRRVPGVPNG
ncbi:hypothetical protein GCM10010252_02940 [Streptomyces aureoverticillatus]|nr:hypothetical protein GCM10010252_02940 [Streptomyces aureoverticillatus]